MHSSLIFLASALALSASVYAGSKDVLLTDTRQGALPVLPKVVGMMQQTVAEKGASAAIPVCKEQAPQLLRAQSEQTGWPMRRVSLKARNSKTGTPDAWEARQLADFNIRAANGEKPETLEHGELLSHEGKVVYRYIRAIPVGEVCLKCHGPSDAIEPGLRAELAKAYPDDRATGYSLGQIRGALTVTRSMQALTQ